MADLIVNAGTMWAMVDRVSKYAKTPKAIAKGKRQEEIISAVGPMLQPVLFDPQWSINTPLRIAHFLGQAAEESDQFCTTREYADGTEYNGRHDLENTQPGDGPRFKGAGLFQLTGRYNYTLVGKILGIDLVNHPELAQEPVTSLKIACTFWAHPDMHKLLNPYADKDDIDMITHRINGGYHGLRTRIAYTDRAKRVLGLPVHAYMLGRDAAIALRSQ